MTDRMREHGFEPAGPVQHNPCGSQRSANYCYGFDGLVVGLLSRGSTVGVLAGALFFGFLRSGGISMEIMAQVPAALTLVIQGLIVIAVAGSVILVEKLQGGR